MLSGFKAISSGRAYGFSPPLRHVGGRRSRDRPVERL